MKKLTLPIIFILLGIGIGYLLFGKFQCKGSHEPTIIWKDTTIYRDFFHDRPIPKPFPVYVNITDTLIERDSGLIWRLQSILDSIKVNYPDWKIDSSKIRLNVYQDSIKNEDFNFKYRISTLGYLVEFNPDIEIFSKTKIISPRYQLGIGVSDRLNYKLGIGFKGWMIEGEFKKKFNQVYLTKNFYIK